MSAGPGLFTSAVETHDYHKGSAPWLDRDVDDANAVQTHHGASAFTHQAALGAPTPPATGVDWDAIAAVVTQHFAQTGEWVPYDQLVGSTSGGDGGAGHVGSDATEISYQTIDYPDAAETNVFGINNFGQSVGSFVQDSTPHAYFSSDDGFVPLDFPPGASGESEAFGIDNLAIIAGIFTDAAGTHGFVASEPGFGSDVFEVVDYPAPGSGTYSTHALGVYTTDPFGPEVLVVGYYEDDVGAMHGFLKDSGGFTAIDVPGASGTFAAGINADPNTDTKIVGSYNISASPNREPVNHGFLLVGDSFTTIDVPGAADTVAYGINADGQIVGYYTDAAGTSHGFLLVGDSFTTIDVPGGVDTVAYGINDHGKISGFYADGTGLQHGFVATIQTPESDVLLV